MSHNHQYAASLDTPEKRQEYDRNRKRNLREINGTGTLGKPFIGVDGEGGNDGLGICAEFPKGHHQYYLLAAGKYGLATGKPLTTYECLDFLCKLSPDAGIYVAFFFDYDVTMILRGMRPERIAKLFDRAGRTFTVTKNGKSREVVNAVDYGEFQVDYMPHKEFKVRRRDRSKESPTHRRAEYGRWVVINDVGQFFQASFVKALTLWDIGTVEERAAIADGKDKRADFTHLEKDTVTYNALEIVLTAKLMEAYRQVCLDIGYTPMKWQGPGMLAAAMMRRHGMPKKEDLTFPNEVNNAAVAAYYGGRFETTAVGDLPGPVYAHDINSAYPDALTRLPCLIHGTFEKVAPGDESARRGRLYLAHGAYKSTETANLYNFPCRRKDGSIHWPQNGSGWYWSVEIEAAAHQTFTADTVFVLNVNCDCVPFDWVPEIYAERLRLGKTTKGMVLKLALNSLYGKTCQSVGAAPYANSVWASLITAMTRAKLMSLCHGGSNGREGCRCFRVYMLATDAIFTRDKLDIPSNKVLGGWELTEHESLFIIMPGLYFTEKGADPKTRGVPRQKIVEYEGQLRDAYHNMVARIVLGADDVRGAAISTHVLVPLIQFVGLKIANHRNRLDLAGEWMAVGAIDNEPGRKVRFFWGSKREIAWASIRELEPETAPSVQSILTRPYLNGGESKSYDKDIGRRQNDARLTTDQPDWADVYKGDEL
jgi:hypothetical protein